MDWDWEGGAWVGRGWWRLLKPYIGSFFSFLYTLLGFVFRQDGKSFDPIMYTLPKSLNAKRAKQLFFYKKNLINFDPLRPSSHTPNPPRTVYTVLLLPTLPLLAGCLLFSQTSDLVLKINSLFPHITGIERIWFRFRFYTWIEPQEEPSSDSRFL